MCFDCLYHTDMLYLLFRKEQSIECIQQQWRDLHYNGLVGLQDHMMHELQSPQPQTTIGRFTKEALKYDLRYIKYILHIVRTLIYVYSTYVYAS